MSNAIEDIRIQLEAKGITQLYGYSRKSRDENGEGLEKHRHQLEAFANELGYPIYILEEQESSETMNRPKMNQLREDVKRGKVKAIVVLRLDRLTRKITDLERLLSEWNFHDVILLEANRQKIIDPKDFQTSKLEGIMNDLYQDSVKQVLFAGRLKAVELYGHHVNGHPPLGYDYNRDTKKLVPNGDAHIVKQIFDLYLEGHSINNIALKLNRQGLTTRNGSHFNAGSIHIILKNGKYIGTQSFGKSQWHKDAEGNVMSKTRTEDLWVTYENAHEPIIDKEVFEKVQAQLVDNRSTPVRVARNTMFSISGLVKCGKCNWTMSVITRKFKKKDAVMIRSCPKTDYTTGEKCKNKGLDVESIEEYLKKELWNNVRPLVLQYQRKIAKGKKLNLKSDNQVEMVELQKRKKELTKQIDTLIDMQLDAGKSDRLMVKMNQLTAQMKGVNEQLQRMENSEEDDSLAWVEHFLRDAEDLIGFPLNWNGMSNEDKNVFLKRYFKSITVLNGEIVEIVYSNAVQELMNLQKSTQDES
jgi:DNA invertase Pin-like site-specific DNA recombinase